MINLNKAKRDDLIKIDGIGLRKAFNIIQYRKENNGFHNLEELKKVKGIADKIYNSIKSEVTLTENESIIPEEKVEITVNIREMAIENPKEIHLVGEMNDWNPEDKSYSLTENKNGIWGGKFDLEAGTEYKIMYDSTKWEADKYIGDNGGNLVV
ncbi:MAG: helix-hairpin-helix domain-containing protein [bacterium]